MAGNFNRVLIAFSVPTILALSVVWLTSRWLKNKNSKLFSKGISIESTASCDCDQNPLCVNDIQNLHQQQDEDQEEQEVAEESLANMQLIECAKNQVCSNELNISQTNDSFKESDQKSNLINEKLNLINQDIQNNNNEQVVAVETTKEVIVGPVHNNNKTEEICKESVDADVCKKKQVSSNKLFSECFQSDKTQSSLDSTKNSTRTRCVTSGSGGFITCSSEAGSHNGTYSDIHSEGSCDSGKGSSDIHQCNPTPYYGVNGDSVIVYQFELPQSLCGLLIGRKGFFIRLIKEQSDVEVVVNRHPFTPYMKICTIKGRRYQVKYALQMIRKRFPIEEYPNISLRQINVIPMSYPIPLPQSCQLLLPDGVTCDVILSCTVDAGHFFLQQPTHPTYPSLSRLDQFMTSAYNSVESPPVTSHTGPGIVCAVKAKEGWFRAVITNVFDDGECEVKFVDYGGYSKIAISELRQIRNDFMTLPFQACECYLANVKPLTDDGWTEEVNTLFEYLAQGQILQANIVTYSENNIPYVHLYMIQGASTVFINRELVNRGLAKWVDNL